MIIDSHAHWLPEEIYSNAHFFHKGWGDIDSHMAAMNAAGVDKVVISYPTSDAHLKLGNQAEVARVFNNRVAEIIGRFPNQCIGAAVLPVGDAQAMVREVSRARDELGFKAVSLATSYDGVYLDDPLFQPVFKICQQKRIPIFVHSQIVNPIGFDRVNDPLLTPVIEYVFDTTISIGKLLMSGVLNEFPDVAFIFAHFGGVTPFLAHRYDATYQMLRSINFVKDLHGNPTEFLKRIYVDTSGDTTKSNLEAALEVFGPGHILWGSDWPAKKDIAGSIQAISDLDIQSEDKERILGVNLEKLMNNS